MYALRIATVSTMLIEWVVSTYPMLVNRLPLFRYRSIGVRQDTRRTYGMPVIESDSDLFLIPSTRTTPDFLFLTLHESIYVLSDDSQKVPVSI
jgi:hypothetical protein